MRTATLTVFAAVLALAAPAAAQCTGTAGTDFTEVTIRDINAIPQANIDQLNAAGATLTNDQIVSLIKSPLEGERVEFTAVILTDPLKSGLASANDGIPGRIHVFMRDTAAETEGNAGMGIQIVDGRGDGSIQTFFVGDEVTVCGEVTYFNNTLQMAPESINSNANPRSPGDPILDPIVITTDDIHDSFSVDGAERSQVDWDVFSDYNNQYVRLENAELIQGISGSRPNMLFSSAGEETTIRTYDTSVCYRNDRDASYFPANQEPACNQSDFVPPATGIVNVQGFLTLSGTFDAFTSSVPPGGAFALNPIEESDFEIAVAPPIITVETPGLATPAGVAIAATVIPGTEGNTVTGVTASYSTTSGTSGTVDLTNTSGDLYEGTITGVAAGDFVTYSITAVDNENNASTPTDEVSRLVVDGAVTSIFQVQATADGGAGGSGITTADAIPFDLDATVQSAFTSGGDFYVTIQDDASLAAFSGVWIYFDTTDPGLSVGDQITITEARVEENFNVTILTDLTFTTTGTGTPYGYKEVTTDLFSGPDGAATAEQHEGILLSFDDVRVAATNADAPSGPFGEFLIRSEGTDATLRVDDLSDGIVFAGNDPGAVYVAGSILDFVRGPLYFSFGNYKLAPTGPEDIGDATIAREGDLETGAARIVGAFPNPAGSAARVRFELATTADVSLRVFDTTGRQVLTLAEGARTAGSYDVSADVSGLAAGVYVLRLVADGDVATARMAVVR